MNGPIRRLAMALLLSMAALLAGVTWYQVVRADDLKTDPRNPRPALSARGKERGLIVTIDGTIVARSVEEADTRDFEREYPEGPVFAHVVGFSSFLVGDTALEAAYSTQLRSRKDLTISDLVAALFGADLRPRSLEITVDTELQRAAFDALGQNLGAIVALDPKTGAVLASVSKPSFDPSLLLGDSAAIEWEALLLDSTQPLLDRATREVYAPGSTFKVIDTIAALDSGEYTPESEFDDPEMLELPGSTATISNAGGQVCNDGNSVRLLRAFVRSCNTTFAQLAMELGADRIGDVTDSLLWNTDLPYEWSVPEAAWDTAALRDDLAALAQSGIGERDVRATPLHMAMLAATVANNGILIEPYLVQRVFDSDGQEVETREVRVLGAPVPADTASLLAQMMERVVTEGTGRQAAVPGVRVAGKTGTAQGPAGFPQSWFIGFAPMENPTIAIAVFVEGSVVSGESASGGATAAPIASELIELWLRSQG